MTMMYYGMNTAEGDSLVHRIVQAAKQMRNEQQAMPDEVTAFVTIQLRRLSASEDYTEAGSDVVWHHININLN